MDWEKRLKELNGYNISFEIKQGYYHIALVFEDGWNILTPDNDSIYVEERNGLYHYIASIDNVKIEDMFNAIDETIEYNMDLQKKLILFKQKTQELQELFATEDYEKLQTIEFTFKKKQEKVSKRTKSKSETKEKTAKKTRTKKVKKEEKPKEENTEEVVNNVIPDYDANDEIVTMNNNYIEELER